MSPYCNRSSRSSYHEQGHPKVWEKMGTIAAAETTLSGEPIWSDIEKSLFHEYQVNCSYSYRVSLQHSLSTLTRPLTQAGEYFWLLHSSKQQLPTQYLGWLRLQIFYGRFNTGLLHLATFTENKRVFTKCYFSMAAWLLRCFHYRITDQIYIIPVSCQNKYLIRQCLEQSSIHSHEHKLWSPFKSIMPTAKTGEWLSVLKVHAQDLQ